jgi:hypothetical protein
MKKSIFALFIITLFNCQVSAQKIFSVEYVNQADVKVFVVKYENQAGWKNNSKQALLY